MEKALLLVDDEENILRSLRRLLRSDGYTIYTANSGKEGLEVLKENKVCVILSDMRMPEMNGAEFLAKVKEQYPETIRMMLSGYTDLNSVTDAINQGAIFKFLTKPWEDDEIKQSIKEAFSHYQKEHGEIDAELKESSETKNTSANQHQTNNTDETISSDNILKQLPIGVMVIDGNGSIHFANDSAQQFLSIEGTKLEFSQAADKLPEEIVKLSMNGNKAPQITRLTLENGITVDVKTSPLELKQNKTMTTLMLSKC